MNTTQETTHLRTKSRFYVAGWTANSLGEQPQDLPKSCVGNPVVENQHVDYLCGFLDGGLMAFDEFEIEYRCDTYGTD